MSARSYLAAAGAAVLGLPMVANAAIATAVTDGLTAVGTDISTVGSALLVLAGIALGVRWVKATFF